MEGKCIASEPGIIYLDHYNLNVFGGAGLMGMIYNIYWLWLSTNYKLNSGAQAPLSGEPV